MKKKILIGIGILLLLLLAVGGYFVYRISQPLYRVGMLREGKNLRSPLDPPVQTGDDEYWQVEEDIRLWHFSQGSGRNVLIVHGGPGMPTRQPWQGLVPLADEYRFHYYDQRGCGQSTRPIQPFNSTNYYENMTELDQALGLEAQLADIERIRQILGEEKLFLVGHSWGGFMAALYASEFPERVEALVLVSPATMLVMPQDDGEDLFTSVRSRLPEDELPAYDNFMKAYLDYGSLFEKSEDDLIALNEQFGKYYGLVAPNSDSIPAQGEPGGWMVFGMYMSMGTRHDYRPGLKQVSSPVLVMHGTQDLQTEAASRQYADLFPNAQFVVIEQAGHFSFENAPGDFSRELSAFLNSLE